MIHNFTNCFNAKQVFSYTFKIEVMKQSLQILRIIIIKEKEQRMKLSI